MTDLPPVVYSHTAIQPTACSHEGCVIAFGDVVWIVTTFASGDRVWCGEHYRVTTS
jgi:hypothetical protein